MRKTRARYGSWTSPFQVEQMLSSSVGLGGVGYAGDTMFWTESRPNEKGRTVIVRRNKDGSTTDLTPAGFNARTRVHEYGGASFTTHGDEVLFANFADQRLYRHKEGGQPEPLSAKDSFRVADLSVDKARNRVIFVCEEHAQGEVWNYLGAVSLDAPESTVASQAGDSPTHKFNALTAGRDFYASPRLSPDGKWMAWICWDHPNMPWDDTELWVAKVAEDGTLYDRKKITGGVDESVMDPQWAHDSKTLYFVSDRSNWWNLYSIDPTADTLGEPRNMHAADVEFGGPMWQLGGSSYCLLDDGRLACTYNVRGMWHFALIDGDGKKFHKINLPYTVIGSISARGNTLAMVVGSSSIPGSIVEMDLDTNEITVVKRSTDLEIDQRCVSKPKVVEVPTTLGATTYALFYAPKNNKFMGTSNEKPPLVVMSHGGPTSSAGTSYSFLIQYFTSRGFAVADVNYRGSTGFGRNYRNALRGNWGVVDWQDCQAVALYLARKRKVDRKRLAIRGGSAGGYTTLAALAWGSAFKAGASHYGVGDLTALAEDTHKFESRYLDRSIGPYPAAKDLYESRSPLNAADKFDCPVIFFQGLEDKVVPPNQAEAMVAALKEKGLPVSYIAFEGEQHGFRQAPNIKRAIQGEFVFYSKIFGFTPADEIEPVHIHNF